MGSNIFGQILNNPQNLYTMSGGSFNAGFNPYGSSSVGEGLATGIVNVLGAILNGTFGSTESIHNDYDGKGTRSSSAIETLQELKDQKNELETVTLPKYQAIVTNPEEGMDKSILDAADESYRKAYTNVKAKEQAYNVANVDFENAEKAYNNAKAQTPTPSNLNELKSAMEYAKTKKEQALVAKEEAEKQLSQAEQLNKEANEIYKENVDKRFEYAKTKIEETNKEIAKLDKKIAKAEASAEKSVAKDANDYKGILKDNEYNSFVDKNGNPALSDSDTDLVPYAKKAMSYFTSAKSPEDKKKYAQHFTKLYDKLTDSEKKQILNGKFVYENAKEYLS